MGSTRQSTSSTMTKQILAVALATSVAATAAEEKVAMNPIRKVVNLLQAMNKKIGAEGDRADELHKKFMCYCESSEGDLQASTSQKVQLESDLKQHQVDRAAAKKAMAEATSLREKEKATYDKALADNTANLAATKKATVAIEQGMGGSFLQTSTADLL